MTSQTPALVVGAGGLLGSGIRRRGALRGLDLVPARVRWTDQADARADLETAIRGMAARADGGPWSLLWCAGAGVTATSEADLETELDVMQGAADAVAALPPPALQGLALFYASSAGSVYAGAQNPPFTERTEPAPLAAYGRVKLRAERIFGALAAHGVRVAIGRISNIYGPGQNLDKPQGLISQLCLAHHEARPAQIYVSLDTMRDYLYVDDCADLVLDLLARTAAQQPGTEPVLKILAAGTSVTIAELIGTLRALNKRKPQAILGASRLGAGQARELRFRSVVWPELDQRTLTPLPVGIVATSEDIGMDLRRRGPR